MMCLPEAVVLSRNDSDNLTAGGLETGTVEGGHSTSDHPPGFNSDQLLPGPISRLR
jgi:hypothetical protein